MSDSWLEEDQHRFRDFCAGLLAWWRETTDVVLLNSPWLKRSTGRGLRCVWIAFHLLQWFLLLARHRDGLIVLRDNCQLLFELIVVMCCFAQTLWVSLSTDRDGFWSGLLFCVGILLSFSCYDTVRIIGQYDDCGFGFGSYCYVLGFDTFCYTIVTLFHCNVHPVAILSVLGSVVYLGAVQLWFDDVEIPAGMALHLLISCSCILLAFSIDFSNRIKAVSSGVLHGESSSANPLESPLAGRSGRTPCWLAALNSWFWFIIGAFKANLSLETRTRLAAVAALVICLALVLLTATKYLDGLRSDIALGLVCYSPPTLLLLFQIETRLWRTADMVEYVSSVMFWLLYLAVADLMATQTLIQAGCHPLVCACFALPLFCHVVLVAMHWLEITEAWLDILLASTISLMLIASHAVDYFARMKAIQEGLASSEQNARSRERMGETVESLG